LTGRPAHRSRRVHGRCESAPSDVNQPQPGAVRTGGSLRGRHPHRVSQRDHICHRRDSPSARLRSSDQRNAVTVRAFPVLGTAATYTAINDGCPPDQQLPTTESGDSRGSRPDLVLVGPLRLGLVTEHSPAPNDSAAEAMDLTGISLFAGGISHWSALFWYNQIILFLL
jgi:hypothetical protein